jgi:hypothetical protein
MADYTKKNIRSDRQFGGVPYGNSVKLPFALETTAAGVVKDSNASAALGSGDTVVLGILPAGLTLLDSLAIVSDAFTASSTLKIGFKYVDGEDVSAVPQDDDYFYAALAINTVGRTRAANTAVKPLTLPKDAYLFVTHSAHTQAEAGRLDVIIEGLPTGVA